MDIEQLLLTLKPLADSGGLAAFDAARAANRDVHLLLHATMEADARCRAAVGTNDFEPWGAVALACAEAIRLGVGSTATEALSDRRPHDR